MCAFTLVIVIFGKFPQNFVKNNSLFSSLDKSVHQKNIYPRFGMGFP